jgi:hypothetical protein
VVLNPKAEYKNQMEISNYCEINPNSTLKRNSNFWSPVAGNLFFLTTRSKRETPGQISSNLKFPRIFNQFSLISTHRNFLKFSFKIHFESDEASIRKVVSYFKCFPTIFYFTFLEYRKIPFGSVKLWRNLNPIEPFKFEPVKTI